MLAGCRDNVVDRNSLNIASKGAELPNRLSLQLHGASLLSSTTEESETVMHALELRAQSFDVRIDLKSNACRPTLIHLTLTQLETDRLEASYRTFLDELPGIVSATEGAVGGTISLNRDVHNPHWMPLGDETHFTTAVDPSTSLKARWTVCMARSAHFVRVIPGHIDPPQCNFPTLGGPAACSGVTEPSGIGLAGGALTVRQRLKRRAKERVTLAIWANSQGNQQRLGQLIDALNSERPDLLVFNGDITARGTSAELLQSANLLDSDLEIPWVGTLGDRDVIAGAAENYVSIIGASNFAFDVASTRVIVLDSADQAIGQQRRDTLKSWLERAPLGWSEFDVVQSLIITHTPPFDIAGLRGSGLKQRQEGASLVALARQRQVPLLLTGQVSAYAEEAIGATRVIHGGGGGLTDPYWLRLTIDPTCQTGEAFPCAYGDTGTECPCLAVEQVWL